MVSVLVLMGRLLIAVSNLNQPLWKPAAQEMIAEADVDGDGNVNYEEFVGMIFKGVSYQMKSMKFKT